MHFGLNIVIILISAAFRGAVLIRGNTVLSNISRSKGNHTMKFGQLIEYNMKNIFLEKSYLKCDGETNPKLFF